MLHRASNVLHFKEDLSKLLLSEIATNWMEFGKLILINVTKINVKLCLSFKSQIIVITELAFVFELFFRLR